MIKLIASDLDGTILLNGAQSVDGSLINTVDKLVDMGYIFAPASGRQISSLKMLFKPIDDKLMYIAENGALVKYKQQTIVKNVMDKELALDIIEDVLRQPCCEVLVSGENVAYIKPKTEEYYNRMTKVVKYKTQIVDDFKDIKEDILKIAVCDLSGIDNSKDHFKEKWGNMASAVVSGKLYLDFMASEVSKGHAMKQIQEYMGIETCECMAFGDNYNDIEMLDNVTHSYVMDSSCDDIKKHGKYICSKVEDTLLDLLKTGKL